MAHPIPQYMGVTSFPYNKAKMSRKNLVSILLAIGLLQDILCLIFNFMEARSGQNYLFYIVYLELFYSITVINLLQVKLVLYTV